MAVCCVTHFDDGMKLSRCKSVVLICTYFCCFQEYFKI
nr:MAG TPA: hypothetical protein [Caudoviricetes sp.]